MSDWDTANVVIGSKTRGGAKATGATGSAGQTEAERKSGAGNKASVDPGVSGLPSVET